METAYKDKIYDRLLEIRFKIDISAIPDPQQINQKIGECHSYIEEVEHFNIRVHRELSVIQQALNNAQAEFDLKKDTLLTQEPIKSLPNIKDREAQSNLLLRKDCEKVKDYQNELNDLNNLLKAVSLKIRNLNRANGDIKLQLRVLEAQVKLGAGTATSVAAKSLMEEMHKSTMNKDSFEEVLSEVSEETVVDPSVPLDIEEMLTNKDSTQEGLLATLIDPVPELSLEEEELPPPEEWAIDDEKALSIEKNIPEEEDNGIDLDNAIEINKKEEVKKEVKEEKKGDQEVREKPKKEVVNQKEDQSKKNDDVIDIDDLLNNYS